MMPEWLQIIYGFVLIVLIPFCAWLAAYVTRCRVDITKLQVQLESVANADKLRAIEIDNRCKAEHDGRAVVRTSLGRLERNVVMIGSKMNLDLEKP